MIQLDVSRIRDEDLHDNVPGRLQKQGFRFEDLNGLIIPVNLTASDYHNDANSSRTNHIDESYRSSLPFPTRWNKRQR